VIRVLLIFAIGFTLTVALWSAAHDGIDTFPWIDTPLEGS
jgi:hypothetical protein